MFFFVNDLGINMNNIAAFRDFIWDFYYQNRRNFAWRNIDNPYYVLVSEIMLQQTQTHRVVTKYEEFIVAFPSFESLAAASLRDVLSVWQGLGYYRRARYLHQIAQRVVNEYGGFLPHEKKKLQALPGIGAGTAGSLGAFVFNQPTVFIETNIRTVFIHCFFQNNMGVSDKEILPLVAASVDHDNPREWYYALMDYGVWCKLQHVNPSRKSAHYTKQSKFEGSDRQIRACILKMVTVQACVTHADIIMRIDKEVGRVEKIIDQLVAEGFIKKMVNGIYSIV
jgi:A/G-specific adenine glycosylase